MSSNEWKDYVFSDFVAISPSVRLDSSKEYSFVEMKDLNENRKYATPSTKRPLSGGARFENGDTLFARITPCLENGKICQVRELDNERGFGSTEFLVFRGKEEVSDSDFVYYLSRSNEVRRFAEQNMHGTSGRQRVAREAFDNLILTLPPLHIQKRIAAILSALDEKIELNRQMNRTLEAIAQALFKEWFVDFRFPGATGELQESPLGMIPKGWSVEAVCSVCEVNGWTLSAKDKLETIDYIEISETNRGEVANIPRYIRGEEPGRARRRLRHGDTVISTVRPDRGSYFLALEPPSSLIASTGFAVITPRKVPWGFVHATLTHPEIFTYLGHVADGGAYPAVNSSVIGNLRIVVPAKEIADAFANVVEPIYSRMSSNRLENQSLAQIRDELLPKLLSGQIEVPVVENHLETLADIK